MEVTKKELEDTIQGLSDAFEIEFEENKEHDVLREYFKGEITNFEEFYILKMFTIEQIITGKFKEFGNMKYKLSSLAQNYQYFESNVTNIVCKKEGGACSVDKSRWLLSRWIDYIKTQELPDMNIDKKCYWKPGFGEAQIWMDYITSLHNLLHGNNEEYFDKFLLLMKS